MIPLWKATTFAALIAALTMQTVCLTGCDLLNTGPQLARDVTATGKAIAFKLVDQTTPENGQAGGHGSLNDPRYGMSIFVGHGMYFDLEMWIQGADLRFDIMANLIQATENAPDLRQRIHEIIAHPEMSEDAKRTAIIALLEAVLNRPATEKPKPDPAPGDGGPVQ